MTPSARLVNALRMEVARSVRKRLGLGSHRAMFRAWKRGVQLLMDA
jgi:hypothetical protein